MRINITAENNIQKVILDYLEENASDVLVNKINNGVEIEKDGKKLINKKTLKGFWNYATNEAQKMSEKGARIAAVEDTIVFGWAIHYFEEDTIEENLYNLDGTEYKTVTTPVSTSIQTTQTPIKRKTKQEQQGQISMFDMFDMNESTNNDIEDIEDDIQEIEQNKEPVKTGTPLYQKYINLQNKYPNHTIIMRLGDFYEVFGQNAIDIGNLLDLTITGRDCGLDNRVPMIGFPYHAAELYFTKIQQHKSCVIYETENEILIREKTNSIVQKTTRNPIKTTLFDKYKELIDAYPGFIIAMETGDFYEVYGKYATILSKEFNFTLQQKDMQNGSHLPYIKFFCDMKEYYGERISKKYSIAFGNTTDNMSFYTIQ